MSPPARSAVFASRPLAALAGPRDAVRQFTPNWFAAVMGTGVLALALGQWPGSAPKLALLGEWLCLANSAVFVAFCAMYAARWLLFFDEARRIFGHATMSMFLGTLPMALATLINGLLRFGLPRWGAAAVLPLAEALWWLDVAMALACGVAIPWLMFTRQRHRLEQMTAVWLLPIVAA
ncbi:C4-dicarboxylate ABC transporter, partial [Xanthomonas sp. Kuri4-2]